MFAERVVHPKVSNPLDEGFVDDSFYADLSDHLAASKFASSFYGQTAEENLPWVRAIKVPPQEEIFRVQNGFNVDAQIAGYLKLYSDMLVPGANIEAINSLYAKNALQNYEGYNFEFITRESVMINPLKRIDGKIIAHKYNNTPLEKIPNGSERDGVYIETVKLLVKELAEAKSGTVFAITSPKGWAGTDANGNTLEFPESQTYLYRINDKNELEAITIRTDMTTDEHEKFLKIMTQGEFQTDGRHSNKERLKHVSGSLVKRTNMDFTDVIHAIQETTGRDVAWTDGGKKRVTFDQMLAKIGNLENLYSIDEKVEKILENFNDQMSDFGYVKSDADLRRMIKLLGQTALDISHAHRVKTGKVIYPNFNNSRTYQNPLPIIDYAAEAQYVSVQPGCAAVTSGNASWQMTALGKRLVQSIGGKERNWKFDQEGECEECGNYSKELGPCGVCEPCNDKIDAMEFAA